MIVAWSGSITTIPYGWALCDGTNGTPDLRGRFIIGTGSWSDVYGSKTYSPGDTGGERKHQLTIAEMPLHGHPTLVHIYHENTGELYTDGAIALGQGGGDAIFPGYTGTPDFGAGHQVGGAGGNQPHDIMPPFYSLAYIMRII